jgi:hypothetical protein
MVRDARALPALLTTRLKEQPGAAFGCSEGRGHRARMVIPGWINQPALRMPISVETISVETI